MIEDNQLKVLLRLPVEERLKLARILIGSTVSDESSDLSEQAPSNEMGSLRRGLSVFAGRYAGGPGNSSDDVEAILETESDTLSGLSVR